MSPRAAITIGLILFIVLLATPAWPQCSMCRTALESSAEGRALAGSFRQGILLLLATPYVIFGAVGIAIYRARKRKSRSQVTPMFGRE